MIVAEDCDIFLFLSHFWHLDVPKALGTRLLCEHDFWCSRCICQVFPLSLGHSHAWQPQKNWWKETCLCAGWIKLPPVTIPSNTIQCKFILNGKQQEQQQQQRKNNEKTTVNSFDFNQLLSLQFVPENISSLSQFSWKLGLPQRIRFPFGRCWVLHMNFTASSNIQQL